MSQWRFCTLHFCTPSEHETVCHSQEYFARKREHDRRWHFYKIRCSPTKAQPGMGCFNGVCVWACSSFGGTSSISFFLFTYEEAAVLGGYPFGFLFSFASCICGLRWMRDAQTNGKARDGSFERRGRDSKMGTVKSLHPLGWFYDSAS